MVTPRSRRSFLLSTGAAAATGILSAACRAHGASKNRTPAAKVHQRRVISHQSHLYHGWPTLTRRANGELLLVFSGGREAHVCPFGRVELMRSDDQGRRWSWPQVLLDSAIDDRDAGVLETSKGTILVTTFTSLAYEPIFQRAQQKSAEDAGGWPEEKLQRWQAAHQRLNEKQRREELGVWMIRSTDDGRSWSRRYDCLVDSPHGPIELSDRRLLYAGKQLWRGENRVGVCQSTDDGQSWQWLAEIPARPGDDPKKYHELHAVEAADGQLIVQLRNHNQRNYRETLQCQSTDGGRSWSRPRSIGVWGLPSHLLRLRDDRLLMTYGHRREPLGNQARISDDHGQSWSEAMIISGDGISGDLGYPSTVQLEDGSLLTVWYERMQGSPYAVLRQAHWSIEG